MTADTSSSSQYLLLLRQPNGPIPEAEELRKIMSKFAEWMNGLYAQGAVVGTNGLETSGALLRGPRGKLTTDGPFTEAKEIVGGYVLIKASSLEEAIEIGRNCPGLDYGMAVEVRPVKER